jgi:glutamyl endopeptidase
MAQASDPHEAVSNDGRGLSPVDLPVVTTMMPGYRGDGRRLREGEVDDRRASNPGGIEDAKTFAKILAAPPAGGPSRQAMDIIGKDQRVPVNPATNYPDRAVVHIFSDQGTCTGFLISKDTIATAGHCVHSEDKGWITTAVVSPGRNGASLPYGSCNMRRVYSVKGWVKHQDEEFDYGAIKLDCDIGLTTGVFGVYYAKIIWNGTFTYLSGYPGDKGATQWQTTDTIDRTTSHQLFYRHDTKGGQSGSPVWYDIQGCSVCAISIHTNGRHGIFGKHDDFTHGTKIRAEVFNNYYKWSGGGGIIF